jgi:hypothetical protein
MATGMGMGGAAMTIRTEPLFSSNQAGLCAKGVARYDTGVGSLMFETIS